MRATIATPEGGAPDAAIIEVFEAPALEGEPSFAILSPRGYLSPGGWRESETTLAPDAWERDGGRLRLAVAAAVMDQLDPQETCRFCLGGEACILNMDGGAHAEETRDEAPRHRPVDEEKPVPNKTPADPGETTPPPPGETERPEETPSPATRTARTEETPAQEVRQPPAETLSMIPPPASSETPAAHPIPEAEPRRGWRARLLLLLVPLVVAGALVNRQTTPDTQPLPEQQDAPVIQGDTPPPAARAAALSDARDLLRRNAPPEETLAAGKALRTPDAGDQQSDAAFLLLEDAAQKGSAEAMFLVGTFYDPASNLPRGSIPPDMAQARYWYEAARDKGYAESARALSALRDLAGRKARQGDGEARLLLQSWN